MSLPSLVSPGLCLLTGPRSLLAAAFAWTLAHLPPPAPLVVVDGGESVDRCLLAEVAGCLGESPRDLAARVHLGRAFASDQLVTLLEAAAGRHTLLLAPLDPVAREALPLREGARLLDRLVRTLASLGRPPASAVVVCPDLPDAAGLRAALLERVGVLAAAHHRFGVDQPVEEEVARRLG